jgi:hypothetical protein
LKEAVMSWEIDDSDIHQILTLPAAERYDHFIQLVVDWEEAWGLKDEDGWIVVRKDGVASAFPLWPHSAFAEAAARGPWEGAEAESVELDELLESLLAMLEEDDLPVAVFPTLEDEGLLVAPGELRERFEAEMDLGGEVE